MSGRAKSKVKTIATAAIEDCRFRRTSARPARTRGWVWKLSWPILRLAVAGLVLAGGATLIVRAAVTADSFHVQRITVRGNARLSTGEIVALLDGLKGQHLFSVDLDQWRARLLGSPWVAQVRLRRLLPSTIDIAIVERTPMATARMGDRLFLVDSDGNVIDDYGPQYADIDLPIIDGLSGAGTADADAEDRTALVGRVLGALSSRRDLLERISQIDVTDSRDAVVILDDDGTRVQLGDASFIDRLQSYLELAPALQSRVSDIDYVDLRFGPRVFVRPARGSAELRKTGRPSLQ